MKLTTIALSACVLFAASEALLSPVRAASPAAPVTMAQGRSSIAFEGGDGTTCERAVVIKGADNEFDGVASEYRWLSEHHPGWDLIEQSLVQSATRSYDVLDFRTADGQTRRACFDISDFYQP